MLYDFLHIHGFRMKRLFVENSSNTIRHALSRDNYVNRHTFSRERGI